MLRRTSLLFRWLPLAGIAACVLGLTGCYCWGIIGGFDFTDEGSYYLSFVHPENVSDRQTSYFLFGGRIFALLGKNVVAMRGCTLVAMIGGTLLLLHGVRRFTITFAPEILPGPDSWRLIQGSALIASFLGFTISPPVLSYNFQNAFCLLAATGLLLNGTARPRTSRFLDLETTACLAGFAGLVGLDFFIKFSSSIPLAVGGVMFFLTASRLGAGQKTGLCGILLLGFGLLAALYFVAFQSRASWLAGISGTLGALLHGGYAGMTTRRYADEIIAVAAPALRYFAPVWIVALPAVVIVPALRLWPSVQSVVAVIGSCWTLAHLLWLMNLVDYLHDRQMEFYLGLLLLLALLAVGSALAKKDCSRFLSWRLTAVGLLLLSLPYIGAYGTTNNINANCLYQFSPWFVAAGLLLGVMDRIWNTAWPSRIILPLLAMVAACQFYQGFWAAPYRVAGSRSEQTVPTLIGAPATTLRLDQETHNFIVNSRRILLEHNFKPGDDLLIFFDLPGFAFAMGGVSPGHPWYFAGDRNSLALDRMRLEFIDPARRKRAFIVRNAFDRDWNDFLPDLQAAGLNFPEDYRLITPPMVSPFTKVRFEIWAPRLESK